MASASKRTKTTATSTDDVGSESVSTPPQLFIPFQTGPSLERIPEDVLLEILSYLPTLNDCQAFFGCRTDPPVVPSASLVRTPTLRALSQTSRLLRSRCLVMAWRSIELCGASIPKHHVTFYRAIGEATKTGVRVLKACPHLLPLIQTVSVVLTRFRSAEIVPAFAACLATLPNLSTIRVVHAHSQMTTALKSGLEGKLFPSVRKISLPCSAHEIIKSCPNLEEVTCIDGNGSTIIGSLVKGKCQQLRVLRCTHAPLTRLVKALPNLRHISVVKGGDIASLANFPFLDTIEVVIQHEHRQDLALSEIAASEIKKASDILKENKSQAVKRVLVTKWNNVRDKSTSEYTLDRGYMIKEAIRVW